MGQLIDCPAAEAFFCNELHKLLLCISSPVPARLVEELAQCQAARWVCASN